MRVAGAQIAAQIEPVHLRHHHIEDDHIGLLALEGREGQGAVVDAQAGVPRALDDFCTPLADVPARRQQ